MKIIKIRDCVKCKEMVFAGNLGVVVHTQFRCKLTGEDVTDNVENETIHPACPLEDYSKQI